MNIVNLITLIRIRQPTKVKLRKIYYKRNKTSIIKRLQPKKVIKQSISIKVQQLKINKFQTHQHHQLIQSIKKRNSVSKQLFNLKTIRISTENQIAQLKER